MDVRPRILGYVECAIAINYFKMIKYAIIVYDLRVSPVAPN